MAMYRLRIVDSRNKTHLVPLVDDEGLFIGSAQTCQIHLEDRSVRAMHGLIHLKEDTVFYQSVQGVGKTMLNGSPAPDQTVVNIGDELSIGKNSLLLVCHDSARTESELVPSQSIESQQEASNIELEDSMLSNPTDFEPIAEFESGDEDNTESASFADSPFAPQVNDTAENKKIEVHSPEQLRSELESANETIELLKSELQVQLLGQNSTNSFENSSNDDQADLLLQEVSRLQLELEESKLQVEELLNREPMGEFESPFNDEVGDQDHSRLEERLVELLDEAEATESRVNYLEELLRESDLAVDAEREERQHLEKWLGQIEQLVSQRDAETKAEVERLKGRIAEQDAECENANKRLELALRIDSEGGASDNSQTELIDELQTQNKALQLQLDETNQSLELAQNASQELSDAIPKEEFNKLEFELNELRAESARDKSEMASLRLSISKMKVEVESEVASRSDSSIRVEALKEHLRELHNDEEFQRRERSLSRRISRLWKGSPDHR